MSNTLNAVVAVVPPTAAAVVAYVTSASPLEYGIVGVVLTVGLFPIVKWMMNRMDFSQKQEAVLIKSREDRADKHLEQLTNVVIELRTLNNNHREFASYTTKRLDAIHDKVVAFTEEEEEE